MNINKKTLFLISLLLLAILPVVASAQVSNIVDKVKTMFINIGAAIVVIGWIIAGILYLTAAGSPEKVGTAKKAMVACVIGTALIILAEAAQGMLEFYLK